MKTSILILFFFLFPLFAHSYEDPCHQKRSAADYAQETLMVKSGDHYWCLAQAKWGHPRFTPLLEAFNPQLKNRGLYPGEKITLYSLEESFNHSQIPQRIPGLKERLLESYALADKILDLSPSEQKNCQLYADLRLPLEEREIWATKHLPVRTNKVELKKLKANLKEAQALLKQFTQKEKIQPSMRMLSSLDHALGEVQSLEEMIQNNASSWICENYDTEMTYFALAIAETILWDKQVLEKKR